MAAVISPVMPMGARRNLIAPDMPSLMLSEKRMTLDGILKQLSADHLGGIVAPAIAEESMNMHSNFCPKHGDRLVPKSTYNTERPAFVMVCEKCMREGDEASQLESDRARAMGED